jgi:hypothetical protein
VKKVLLFTQNFNLTQVFYNQHSNKRLPSWTGGVPRPMNEVNWARRGGGFNFKKINLNDGLILKFFDSTTPSLICLHLRRSLIRATPPVQEGSLFYIIFKKYIINKTHPITMPVLSPLVQVLHPVMVPSEIIRKGSLLKYLN